jgi:pSer/pThr/pTyr-binding forkhead associated (FHA) protein
VPELEILTGPRAGQRISVARELTVGRSGTDLELADAEASRHHAILRVLESGELEIEDLGSTNGTWIGDERVDGRALVTVGAELRIGATVMRQAAVPAPTGQATPLGEPEPELETFRPPTVTRRRGQRSAALLLGPTIVSLLVVVATTIALVVYFAAR